MAIHAGDVLRGKYRLDALIGRGGMGQVFAATDLESGRDVAVKVVSRLFFDDILMQRLHREAEAAARIQSDFVPRVVEVADTESGEVFLVMERLVGEPLSQRLRDRGALPWEEVAHIGQDVLRGLMDAHAAGIVHRDLKPSNVFLAMRGDRLRAMVLDFGVCKMDTLDTERLTATGESIGTVAYMAPEQIRGAAKVDTRADLYAFGVLVFEMLTGRLPHEGPTQMAILASKLENDAVRLRDHVAVPIPTGLDDLVTRTLSRDPENRQRSAEEVLQGWTALLGAPQTMTPGVAFVPPSSRIPADDAPTRVSGPPLMHGAPAAPMFEALATQTALTAPGTLRKGSSTRVAFALAACALVAGVACVAAFFMRAPSTPTAHAATAAPLEETSAAPSPSPSPPPTATEESDDDTASASLVSIELPSDQAVDAGAHVTRAAPHRAYAPRVRVRPPPPKPSGQHITSQPRY